MNKLSKVMFVLGLLSACVASAKDRQWKDADVVNIVSGSENQGVAVVPIGTMLAGVPITTNTTLYEIQTDDMTYVLSYSFNPLVNWRNRPPNLTVHGRTKISIDGRNAYVEDDEGKDVKVPIMRKYARNQTPSN